MPRFVLWSQHRSKRGPDQLNFGSARLRSTTSPTLEPLVQSLPDRSIGNHDQVELGAAVQPQDNVRTVDGIGAGGAQRRASREGQGHAEVGAQLDDPERVVGPEVIVGVPCPHDAGDRAAREQGARNQASVVDEVVARLGEGTFQRVQPAIGQDVPTSVEGVVGQRMNELMVGEEIELGLEGARRGAGVVGAPLADDREIRPVRRRIDADSILRDIDGAGGIWGDGSVVTAARHQHGHHHNLEGFHAKG